MEHTAARHSEHVVRGDERQALSQASPSVKRTHPADDTTATTIDQRAGFVEFQSRYSKRARRCQEQQQQRGVNVSKPPSPKQLPHDTSKQKQKQKPQQSSEMSQLMDEAIDSVVLQSQSPQVHMSGSEGGDKCIEMRAELHRLQQQVCGLQKQIEFLMTVIGIVPDHTPTGSNATSSSSNPTQVNNHDDSSRSYAAVTAASLPKLQGPLRNALLTAVHTDLQLKQSRNHHVVVTGLPHNTDMSDDELFKELCDSEFGIVPQIERTQRLGKKSADRPQPLLIVLSTAEQATSLLSYAKSLRDSYDAYTRRYVFLSVHQTHAERQAAYELRCKRRERREREAEAESQQPAKNVDTHQQLPQPRGRDARTAPSAASAAVRGNNHGNRDSTLGNSKQQPAVRPSPVVVQRVNDGASTSASNEFGVAIQPDNVVDGRVLSVLSTLRADVSSFSPSTDTPGLAAAVAGSCP